MSSIPDIFSEIATSDTAVFMPVVQETSSDVEETSIEQLCDANFIPKVKETISELGLSYTVLESLALKYILVRGNVWGREICAQLKLPFAVVTELMRQMKNEQLVAYKNSTSLSDYNYELTVHVQSGHKGIIRHALIMVPLQLIIPTT